MELLVAIGMRMIKLGEVTIFRVPGSPKGGGGIHR